MRCLHLGAGLVMVPLLLGSKWDSRGLRRLSPSFGLLVVSCILHCGVAITSVVHKGEWLRKMIPVL